MGAVEEMHFKRSPESELPINVDPETAARMLGYELACSDPSCESSPARETAREVTVALLITALVGAIGTGFVMLVWHTLGEWFVFPAIFLQAWIFCFIWARITD